VISDQYESHQIEKNDGSIIIGRVVSQEGGVMQVMMNPFAPSQLTPIKVSDTKSKKVYPVSMMPPALLNTLNPDEVLDLLAYLLSAGNPNDKMFATK
jgi:putative heme-binding domain-containing protein